MGRSSGSNGEELEGVMRQTVPMVPIEGSGGHQLWVESKVSRKRSSIARHDRSSESWW